MIALHKVCIIRVLGLVIHFDTVRKAILGAANCVVIRVIGSMPRHLCNGARQQDTGAAQVLEIITAALANHKLFSYAASRRLRRKDDKSKHSTIDDNKGNEISNTQFHALVPLHLVTSDKTTIHDEPKKDDKHHH